MKTVSFESPAVGRTMKYNVVLPASYEAEPDRRYPVLYLLHGLTSNYTHWAYLGVPRAAALHDLIVVMPDAGNSWYVNWAEPAEGHKDGWEDAIVVDLVGHVDQTYRTLASREGRAIGGLSMGGYGAMTLGLRHPDMFCSVASHSGALSFARSVGKRLADGEDLTGFRRRFNPPKVVDPTIGIEGFSSQAERTPDGKLFTTAEQAEAYDPFALVLKLPDDERPHIYLDCGTEDGLIKDSQEFARLLMENKIPFTFAESHGGHTPPYWTREVFQSMAVQAEILRRETTLPPAPDAAKAEEEPAKAP